MYKKLIMFMLLGMFMISFASAEIFSFDNKLTYSDDLKEVNVKDLFGFGKDYADIKITSHEDLNKPIYANSGDKVLIQEIGGKEDYNNFIDTPLFKNMKTGKYEELDYYWEKAIYGDVIVSDYEEICNEIIELNETIWNDCNQVLNGSHIENKIISWENFTDFNIKKDENLTIGLVIPYMKPNSHYDVIPKFFGKEIKNWAEWSNDLENSLIAYYQYNSTSGSVAYDFFGNYNYTVDTVWITGKIGNGRDFNEASNRDAGFDLSACSEISIGFWARRSGSLGTDSTSFIGNLDDTNIVEGELFVTPGNSGNEVNPNFNDGTSTKNFYTTSPDFPDNTWVHMVIRINQDLMNFSQNGSTSNVIALDGSFTFSSYNLELPNGALSGFSGPSDIDIDELGVWCRWITNAEVTQLYNNGDGITPPTYIPPVPTISIAFPTATAYTTTNLDLNYIFDEDIGTADSCWYSLDLGETNSSRVDCGVNWTGLTASEGSNIWTVYGNITSGEMVNTTVSFTVDSIIPDVTIVTPEGGSNHNYLDVDVNITIIDTNLQACWYSNDTGVTNNTFTCGTNLTSIDWEQGINIVSVYANDSANNLGFDNINFNIDSLTPNVTINYPINASIFSVDNTQINSTIQDTNLQACWWSEDIGETNTTFTCNTNITNTWIEGLNTIWIFANDSFGNYNRTESVSFTVDSIFPEVEIITPPDNSNWNTRTVYVNFTMIDTNLQACWYSNDTGVTNNTFTCGTNLTGDWEEGINTIYAFANDTFGHLNNSESVTFTIDTINPNVTINYPLNSSNFTVDNIQINTTIQDTNLQACWWSEDIGDTNTTFTCGTNITNTWEQGLNTVWVFANDSFGNYNRTESVSFTVDTINPVVNITYPTTTAIFTDYATENQAYIEINWSVTDDNLQTCILWNGTENSTVTCGDNTIVANQTFGNYSFVLWANDSSGNFHSDTVSTEYNYSIFRRSESHNLVVSEGSSGTFYLNISLNPNKILATAFLIYGGSNKGSGTITNIVGNNYTISKTITIPQVEASVNKTFFWNLTLSDSINVVTAGLKQTVENLGIDDCSANTNLLYNLTIFDEEDKTLMNGTIYNTLAKVNFQLLNRNNGSIVSEFNQTFSKVNPFTICINNDLSASEQYTSDLQIQYSADNYAIELYHIQNKTISSENFYTNLSLYDLNSTDAQIFKIIYRDSSFLPVQDALIKIYRKYVNENLFRIVEIPKTDERGETVGNFVLNNVIYNLVVVKHGVILETFNNVVTNCQTPLITTCTIDLNSFLDTIELPDFETQGDFNYTLGYDYDTRIVSSNFVIPSGTPSTILLNVTVQDALGTSMCTDSLTSTSGLLTCTIPNTFGNSSIMVKLYKDGNEIAKGGLNMGKSPREIYGGGLAILALFIMITLIGAGLSDNPITTISFLAVGVILLMGLNIIDNSGFIGGTATVLFLFVAIILVIIKGGRRN